MYSEKEGRNQSHPWQIHTDITTVQRWSAPLWGSGVAHLIVHDEVDASTYSKMGEICQGEGLRYYALAWKRSIAMNLYITYIERLCYNITTTTIF